MQNIASSAKSKRPGNFLRCLGAGYTFRPHLNISRPFDMIAHTSYLQVQCLEFLSDHSAPEYVSAVENWEGSGQRGFREGDGVPITLFYTRRYVWNMRS
jgi:hypothetical protein